MIVYSLSYFYSMLPGSDSLYFTGLNEYLIRAKNLDPLPPTPNKLYFKWQSFFILANIATSMSGFELVNWQKN